MILRCFHDFLGFLPIVHVCSMFVSGSIHLLCLLPACHWVQVGCNPMFVRNQSTIDVLFAGKNVLFVVKRPQYTKIIIIHQPFRQTLQGRQIPPCFIIPGGDEMLMFPHWQAKRIYLVNRTLSPYQVTIWDEEVLWHLKMPMGHFSHKKMPRPKTPHKFTTRSVWSLSTVYPSTFYQSPATWYTLPNL